MKDIKIKRLLFIIFSMALNLLFTVNYSTAEVVEYRINAVVDSSNWPADGSCASQVSQPGTTAQLYLTLNEPIIPSMDLECNELGCYQRFTNVVVGWSIKFSDSDECTIYGVEPGMELDTLYVNDNAVNAETGESFDHILIGGHFSAYCPTWFESMPPDFTHWPICEFSGLFGDPRDSYMLQGDISLLEIVDPTEMMIDRLAPPVTLNNLIKDTTSEAKKIRVSVFEHLIQSYYNIVYTIKDVVILNQPSSLIVDLIDATTEINASNGVLNSLDAKLESAVEALDDVNENNDLSAVNKLQAFINAVEAQRGNHISEDDADSLIAAAQEIIDMLSLQ